MNTPIPPALHTIQFIRDITNDTVNMLQDVSMRAIGQNANALRIYISSGGGGTDPAFAAYHMLRSLPVPVEMHCIGNVESAAVILFLAADTRLIVPHGRVKLHALHFGFGAGTVDHDRLAEHVASLDSDRSRYAAIFDERTAGAAAPVDVRVHLGGRALLLNAAEAVNGGIATEVLAAKLPDGAIRWWV